jgi:general secretion pathway protein K
MLEASLEDMQGRFNLNSLVKTDGTPDTASVAAFTKLLELVGLETKWAPMMVDWIDADIVPQNIDGAEDSVYMGQTPPYRTANRYITSTSELLALPGFGRDRYLALAPYIAALPVNGTKINLCTARDKVLDAFLGSGQTDFSSSSGQLEKNRASSPGCFPTLENYRAAFSDPKVWAAAQAKFGQNSTYFRLASFITIGSAEFNLYSLLYRDATGAVRPIQRSFTPD